ncbi:hypothetical protein KZP23_04640 [Echinicola marina]|uniref:Uncharacterized protein n=1 Tax=Echinicola rosea TaxID=1807691 RepID=A0ABQ1V4Z8_9BACT|nr:MULTISPECIES: hypothetical protein [Echinicola]UCS94321.1 hypothetical protein KZP23_04640 [Echinicola marina]GGF38492.1 hypothetical protein GCM10011339_28880 [Echinicola rosea]
MKDFKNHIKILSALSVAASDTRRDTFISVVIRTLNEISSCERKDLAGYINEQFSFEPYQPELDEVVNFLLKEERIVEEKKILSLSAEEKETIDTQDVEARDQEKSRYQNFKNFIKDDLGHDLKGDQVKLLWDTFLEYLYNSFYEYGEDAIKTLHPHIKNGDGNSYYESVLSITMKNIDAPELQTLFKYVIERFPDFASTEDLNFLNDLAQKTLSFSSLGFQADVAQDTINHEIVDWTLYLDTNVLYSLLDLHSHPENEACKALIQLVRENKEHIKVKLRYSDITYKELGKKKADFDLLDDKLTDSSIKAMLKSENLDGFSKKFYEGLLENREGTIHPSEAIGLSQTTLKYKTIEIARNAKRIEHLGEDYINAKVQEFYKYINRKNEIKKEFYDSKKIPFHPIEKSEKQALHDITLRELLLESRLKEMKGEEVSLNSIKYFGVTLDDLLIQFDKSQIKDDNDVKSFPVFFKPSFLLNKLVRILPIQTKDYKKAFIKAVTSKGFHKDSSKSRDVLKIVNYLKSQGIDDERVVYNIISQDIFLEKYHKESQKEDFNQGEFIESELNREFRFFQEQLENTQKELALTTETANTRAKENQKLEAIKSILESDVQQYEKALEKVSKRVNSLEKTVDAASSQEKINFEAGEANAKAQREKEKAEILKKKLRVEIEDQIEKEKDADVRKWQRKTWWHLLWVIPCVFAALFFVLPLEQNPITNQANRYNTASAIMVPVILIFLYLIQNRLWNEGNIKARKENHKVSEGLRNKLRELE